MFTLLSQASVSETPGKAALYVSCTVHLCAVIMLTWFSPSNLPKSKFELMMVHAGSEEPVRKPQPLYTAIRNRPHMPSEHTQRIAAVLEMPRQTESNDSAGFTPTAVPSEFLALLDTQTGSEPAVGTVLAGTRTIPPLALAESSLPPPEPPPGEPDIKPPPVIGGRLEPAELIKQTVPVYPPLARNARVEGVVLLEGTVNVSGSVQNIRVVEGHPLLIDEALRAVKKWKYRPAILNGQPTPSPVTIRVRFTLKYPGE
jgi:periplasmic protein TonB